MRFHFSVKTSCNPVLHTEIVGLVSYASPRINDEC